MRSRIWIIAMLLSASSVLPQPADARGANEVRQIEAACSNVPEAVAAVPTGVVIGGRKGPLTRSQRRLGIPIASLPFDGTHAENRLDIVGWVDSDAVLCRDPNQASGEKLQMMERASAPADGPDPDYGATGGIQ